MKKACVVGYGAIGPVHAKALNSLNCAKLYAVCDINPERTQKAKNDYGVKVFSDYDEMLKSGEVDAVHICTPHYLHKDMAVKALKHGLDVVLEKPVAISNDELNELVEAEKNSTGRLCVMLQNRTNNCICRLTELIKDKEKNGEFISLNGFVTWIRDEKYYKSGPWRGKWATEGGGLLINQAIHVIDLISYLGGGIKSVRGSVSTKWLENVIEVEDTADALFTLKNGNRACFYATNASGYETPFQVDVFMEKVHYRYADNVLYEIRDGKFAGIVSTNDEAAPGKKVWGNGHKCVIGNFYADGEYPNLTDAVNSSRALFAIYESAKSGGSTLEI